MHGQPTLTVRAALAVVAMLAVSASPALAAPINYGDFSDIPPGSVMYLDVTETANTPDDTEPLYGAPTIIVNKLDFDPGGFSATASNGAIDNTDGQLNFTVMATGNTVLDQLILMERGDYTLLGNGTTATQVTFAASISAVTVLEVDGVALTTPVVLPGASAFGTRDLVNDGPTALAQWNLGILYDVNTALTTASVPFVNGATKLEVVINNSLTAISETGTTASVFKKDFMIDVPEPGTLALLGLGLLATATRRR